MKSSHRLGLLVATLAGVLLVVTGVAVHSLLRLGSVAWAVGVGVTGALALIAVGAAWWLARQAEEQISGLLPVLPQEPQPALPPMPARKAAFRVREARPGEVPEPYLAAVRKGAQAREAAWRANGVEPESSQVPGR
jgi:hypothetical protein